MAYKDLLDRSNIPAPRTNLINAIEAAPRAADIIAAVGDFADGAADDMFTLSSHGLSTGSELILLYEAAAGVVTGNTDVKYYAKKLTDNTFQLTNSSGVVIENSADGLAIFLRVK